MTPPAAAVPGIEMDEVDVEVALLLAFVDVVLLDAEAEDDMMIDNER